jgi:hypothetical protein
MVKKSLVEEISDDEFDGEFSDEEAPEALNKKDA